MKKILIKILTLVLACTSLFALSLFTGCDCGGNSGSGGVIPKPEEQVERYLNLDSSALNLIVGDDYKFTASYKKEEGKTLTFESADSNIATVDTKGNLLAYNEGTTTITAKYGDLSATCQVNVSFGNYLPELTFESGLLDVFSIGLDGVAYTFNPLIKFNGKTFDDAEVTFVVADSSIAEFNGANVLGKKLGTTTATVTASWRGFTFNEVPALQRVVNIKTNNVVNFLVNDQIYDTIKLSTFNGEFEGNTYENSTDFKVKLMYNGQERNASVKVDVEDPSKLSVSNDKLTAKAMGRTAVTLSYVDGGETFSTSINVEIIRPVAETGKKFTYFSSKSGYYKDIYSDLADRSIITDIFGSKANQVTDAYVVDGIALAVEGDKILNAPTNRDSVKLNKIVIGTTTYAYSCEIETYGVLVANKEDLALFDVHFTNADETEYSYVEGYSELLRDIDATGFKPKHTAVHTSNAKVNLYNNYGKYYVGMRGTFNGKGFTIFNLDTTRDPITYINSYGNKVTDTQNVGLFGYIQGPVSIKNVAFENMKVVNGAGLAYQVLVSVVDTETTPKGNITYENLYISASEDSARPKGFLATSTPGSRFSLKNVVINAPNLDVGDETQGGLIGNNGSELEKDDRATYSGVYVISKYPLGFFDYYTMYGGNEKVGRDMYSEDRNGTVDLTQYALDTKLGYTPGPNGEKLLYRRKSAIRKYNDISEMANDANNFSTFPDSFWKIEKDSNGGQYVFWKALLGYSYDLYNEDGVIFDSVLFDNEDAKPYKFTVKNKLESITNYSVSVSDSNIIEVKNGAIYLKNYKVGYYEVTLSFTSKFGTPITRVIPVTVDAKHIAAYLQQDGEIVNHGLTEVPAGSQFSINGVNVDYTFENGKLKVDLSRVDLSDVSLASTVDVYMKTTSGYDNRFVSMYVTKAIDEAEELNYFNVGYTYNQAEFDALTSDAEKKAYLEKCEAEPFNYFDGYYVLAKDIDATGLKFVHEAAAEVVTEDVKYYNGTKNTTFKFVKGDVGFIANESTNRLEPLNVNAPIVFGGKSYMIPRDGYPLVGNYSSVTEQPTAKDSTETVDVYSGNIGVPAIFFKKIGFLGTFDGQGHVISNLDTARYGTTEVKYYNDNNDPTKMAAQSMKGAGLFGVLNNGSTVKNVAFVNVDFQWSALLAGWGNTPHGGVLNTNGNEDIVTTEKYKLENVYISAKKGTGKVLSITNASEAAMRGSLKDVIVDMTGANSQYLMAPQNFSQSNSSLYLMTERVYFASTFDVPSTLISRHEGKLFFGSSMADLYANTNILDAFADNPYFEVLYRNGQEGVFFKGTYASTFNVTSEGKAADKILLDSENNAKELVIEDAFGVVENATVECSDSNVLEFANGMIKVKDGAYTQGDFEVTIKVTAEDYNGNPIVLTKTIIVTLAPQIKLGEYLNTIDGEVTGHNLTDINGFTFSINDVETPATFADGKLNLDLSSVNLSDVDDLGEVNIFVDNANGDDYILRVSKVLLAIDEASDLTKFNVGYTYDQAEFDALTSDADKKAYLENAQANPYDYYEGLVILTKDIDATGVAFNHEAVLSIGSAYTEVGFLINEVGNTLTAQNTNAPIVFDGTTYNIPRAGYPAVKKVSTGANNSHEYVPGAYFFKMGFIGTFEGNGYTISNLNTVRTTQPTFYNGTELLTAAAQAPGIFGVINANSVVKNVAFVNAKHESGSLIALIDVSPTGLGANAYQYDNGDIFSAMGKSTRTLFENIYVESITEAVGGTFHAYGAGNRGAQFKNIVLNFPNYIWANGGYSTLFESGVLGGSIAPSQANGSFSMIATNVYVVVNKDISFTKNNANLDFVVAKTFAELFTATENTRGVEKAIMGEIFAENEYFEVVTRGEGKGVYWKGTYDETAYEPSIVIVDENGAELSKVVLDYDNTSKVIAVKDLFGIAKAGEFTISFSNENVLEYVDGVLKVKDYSAGDYELTVTTKVTVGENENTYSKTIKVQLLAETVEGYLQQDGEIIGHGLTSVENTKFSIDEVEVSATYANGKVVLDLANVDLSNVKDKDVVVVSMDSATGKDAVYKLTYILAYVDEASDLQKFNVGYTYDQAEFDALTSDADKKAYLEYAQANPYDFYEGTVILAKDIDATGITFNHEAIFYVEKSNTNIGFTVNEVGNTLTAVNANAAIVFDGVTYNIPRAGYPAFKAVSTSNSQKTYIPGSYFYKAGFYGTFEGNGYTISNLAPDRAVTINYYVGETETEFKGYGAGIFGVINANSIVRNVAITNYDSECGPAFALVDVSPTGLGTASYHYDEKDVFFAMGKSTRTLFENIYFELTGYMASGSTFRYSNGNRGAEFKYMLIDALGTAWSDGAYGSVNEHGYIGGSYPYSNANGSLRHEISNVYIVSALPQQVGADINKTYLDIVMAKSYAELFTATVNTMGKDKEAVMAEIFAENEYFEIVTRGEGKGVYWKGTYDETAYEGSISFVDGNGDAIDSLTLKSTDTEAQVSLKDLFGIASASDVVVTFDNNATGILEYADGAIKVVSNQAGVYEATFTTTVKVGETETDYSKTISVEILAESKSAYLSQVDGEIVLPGLEGDALTALDGAKVIIADAETTASVVDGKLFIDMANSGLEAGALTSATEVTAKFDSDTKDYIYVLNYVTLAIDEADDLSTFNVGYTYDQAEFDALTSNEDKKAYLENAQANPFDYYEGYYVLVKDIDATGWKYYHEAVFATAATGTIGFTADETNDKLVANNANAAIVFDGVTYLIPREGYPLMSTTAGTPKVARFIKAGFAGTFDGQGYVISNLACTGRSGDLDKNSETPNTIYTYYDGEELKFASSTDAMGAGIFGILLGTASVKNVAIVDANVDFGSIFSVMMMTPNTSSLTAGDVYVGNKRPLFENVYIKTSSSRNWGVLTYKHDGVGPQYVNCFFDFTSIGTATKNDFKGTTVLGHGQISQSNGGLQAIATNLYIAVTDTLVNGSAAGHGLNVAGRNTGMDLVHATTVEGLYTATTNDHGTEVSMAADFADNACWTVVGNAVYWHSLVPTLE